METERAGALVEAGAGVDDGAGGEVGFEVAVEPVIAPVYRINLWDPTPAPITILEVASARIFWASSAGVRIGVLLEE
jgi:hypothetical protein